ncbi:hypothetical protein KY289_005322 [Solanum tuberosum]|nr:hypothetical protein KY289_005322 [Solanum tuberosum]
MPNPFRSGLCPTQSMSNLLIRRADIDCREDIRRCQLDLHASHSYKATPNVWEFPFQVDIINLGPVALSLSSWDWRCRRNGGARSYSLTAARCYCLA